MLKFIYFTYPTCSAHDLNLISLALQKSIEPGISTFSHLARAVDESMYSATANLLPWSIVACIRNFPHLLRAFTMANASVSNVSHFCSLCDSTLEYVATSLTLSGSLILSSVSSLASSHFTINKHAPIPVALASVFTTRLHPSFNSSSGLQGTRGAVPILLTISASIPFSVSPQ